MSTLLLEVSEIRDILPHPNAERLEIAQVYGWFVVVQKDKYKKGQSVIYLQPDCVLSEELNDKLFPPDSKVKLDKRRIKTIKLRGAISQGMIVDPNEFTLEYIKNNVTKYEPPISSVPRIFTGQQPKKSQLNDDFKKYTGIEHLKNYDRVFQENEEVIISLKLHGTNARFGRLTPTVNTLWKKILQKIGLLPKSEFVYGSRNVQLSDGREFSFSNETQGVDFGNVYKFLAKKYKLSKVIRHGLILFGEAVGHGVQKDYHYNTKPGDYDLYAFDIFSVTENRWLNYDEFINELGAINTKLANMDNKIIYIAPLLYRGPFNSVIAEHFRNGKDPIQTEIEREGIVIKTAVETVSPTIGRKILKSISDVYWLGKQSDFH